MLGFYTITNHIFARVEDFLGDPAGMKQFVIHLFNTLNSVYERTLYMLASVGRLTSSAA